MTRSKLKPLERLGTDARIGDLILVLGRDYSVAGFVERITPSQRPEIGDNHVGYYLFLTSTLGSGVSRTSAGVVDTDEPRHVGYKILQRANH